jgi:hypothetical protein
MSRYDILAKYRDANPEEKLMILRSEMMMPIELIRGYTTLIKNWAQSKTDGDLPREFETWIDKVIEAGDSLEELLEVFTGPAK